MAAMAAVAVGMFVGTWVIGPAITHHSAEAAPATRRQSARPSRTWWRAPIHALSRRRPLRSIFGPADYAAVAKERAKAGLSGRHSAGGRWTVSREAPRNYPLRPAQLPGI